jgi:hypothetical protein
MPHLVIDPNKLIISFYTITSSKPKKALDLKNIDLLLMPL